MASARPRTESLPASPCSAMSPAFLPTPHAEGRVDACRACRATLASATSASRLCHRVHLPPLGEPTLGRSNLLVGREQLLLARGLRAPATKVARRRKRP